MVKQPNESSVNNHPKVIRFHSLKEFIFRLSTLN